MRHSHSRIALLVASSFVAAGCASAPAKSAPPTPIPSTGTAANRYTVASAAVGTTMQYDLTDGSSQTSETLRLLTAHSTADGIQLSVQEAVPGKPARTVVYLVHPDGSESLPWETALNLPAGWTLRVLSGEITLPAPSVLASGSTQTSQLLLSESNGQESQDVQLTATTRGTGTQQVNVPIGTFQAQVVTQHIVETAGSEQAEIDLTYWLVAGFSTVKSIETVTRSGQTTTETVLLRSMTPPPPSD